MSRFIQIVEVGPRDGLQNESRPVPTAARRPSASKSGPRSSRALPLGHASTGISAPPALRSSSS